MELPPFPPEFSVKARKNVIDAEITATRAMRIAIRSKPELRGLRVSSRSSGNNQVIQLYVLPVLLAFAREACAMGERQVDPWYPDRIDNCVREFSRKLIIGAHLEYDRPDYPVFKMTSDFGYVHREVTDIVEESGEWKAYQDLLLKLESPAPLEPFPASGQAEEPAKPVSARPRHYPEPKMDLLKTETLLNKQQAAAALGVSVRTLDRYVADNRLTPSGDYAHRRFKTKDLRSFLSRKDSDK
jgi:hypothetical protein